MQKTYTQDKNIKIEYKSTLKKESRIKKFFAIFFIMLLLALVTEITTLFLTVVPYDFELVKVLLLDIRILFLNIFPVFFGIAILYCIFNSLGIAFLTVSAITYFFAIANRLKIFYRDDPLVLKDLSLALETGTMLKRYPVFFDTVSVICGVALIVFAILCFLLLRKVKIKKCKNKLLSLGASLVSLTLFTGIFYFSWYDLYLATWHEEFGSEYKSANQCMSHGIIYSLGWSLCDCIDKKPDGYDEKAAKEIIESYNNVPLAEDKKVNIISIMLEAFNDFSKFEQIDFNKFPYENYQQLKADSYSGELFTNCFAAQTVKTERAFLTGFGGEDFEKPTVSYVRYFKDAGYYTEAMHPGYGWFYDRNTVNEYLGFDNFDHYENKFRDVTNDMVAFPKYHDLLSDYDFFDYIINGFEKAQNNGKKYFNFSVTYQNHGPYSEKPSTNDEYLVHHEKYSSQNHSIVNNYFYYIDRTDKALKKLRDYIDAQTEPIVLILFGDHNPWLGEEGKCYEMLGIDIDTETAEGAKNYYSTPYLFYANNSAKAQLNRTFTGKGATISPMFLMNELFDYIGIDGSAYLNYLSDIKENYDVVNTEYLGKDGKYINRSKASNLKELAERQWVEYYLKKKGVKF